MSNNKIKQKVVNIFKQNSVVKGYIDSNGKFIQDEDNNNLILLVGSNDPTSPYFHKYLANTGMLDFISGKVVKYKGILRKENTLNGLSSVYIEREVIVDENRYSVELGGESYRYALYVDEQDFIPEGTPVNKGIPLKVGYFSPSQKRKGDMTYIPLDVERDTHIQVERGFNFDSWYKVKGDKVVFDAIKTFSRVELSASSGKELALFKNYHFARTENKTYQGLNQEIESTVYVLERNKAYDVLNHDSEEPVIKELQKEVKIEVLYEDFEVLLKQKVQLPEFYSDSDEINIANRERIFTRPVTDGAILFDEQTGKHLGLNTSVQFRFTPVAKGMAVLTESLKDTLGVDLVFFGGAVKGNIDSYIRNNHLDFFVLNKARQVKEKENLLLSRQVFGAIVLDCPNILNDLVKETENILTKAYNFEEGALQEFIGLTDEEEEEEILDIDNLTARMYAAGSETFLKSSNNKKKLAQFINSSTQELERAGKLYLPEASIKHMVVDPYGVMQYMADGYMGIRADEVEQKGIRGEHLITLAKTDGDFHVEHEKAFLARFPFLHKLEGQLVNKDGKTAFMDDSSEAYYQRAMKKGSFSGMAIYSLWDMIPEGQSGADFDGDTTVYTTNSIITEQFVEGDLFLDYSILDGEVVEGVPWPEESSITDLDRLFGETDINWLKANQVDYDKGSFSFPQELKDDKKLEGLLADAMSIIAADMNVSSNIGRFTNINTSIMELIYMLKETLEVAHQLSDPQNRKRAVEAISEELAGYEKLSFLMTSAIRWEIDKAKHGGAFMDHLPFLKIMVDGANDKEELEFLEDKFGISLVRLFLGNK